MASRLPPYDLFFATLTSHETFRVLQMQGRDAYYNRGDRGNAIVSQIERGWWHDDPG